MPTLSTRSPKYCLHRATGTARAFIGGREHRFPGPYGSPESRQAFDRLVAEWLSSGRRLPASATPQAAAITVRELVERWSTWAAVHYRKPDGTPTTELHVHQGPLRLLLALYGNLPAGDFGPLKLKATVGEMVRTGWTRRSINRHRSRLVAVFSWGVAEELVPASVVEALRTVRGLQAGRCDAVEADPVGPVSDEDFAATLPHLPPHVRDMVRVLRLTGARAGELCSLRPADLDRSGPVWRYSPADHKTRHKGKSRTILIGPAAQAIITAHLDGCPGDEPIFTPAKSEAARRAERTATRKTPLSCGNRPGTNVRKTPKRSPGRTFSAARLTKAIIRAADKAGVPAWHVHQLRHSAGTTLRAVADLDVARTVLGHAKTDMTQHYAERDLRAAEAVIARVG